MNTNFTSDFNKLSSEDRFEKLPRRIFLDTNLIQYINDFGGFIFENERESETCFVTPRSKIAKGSFLFNQVEALREVLFPIERAPFEFAISYSVYLEVEKKHDHHLNRYFYDLWDYWQTVIEEYNDLHFQEQVKQSQKA